MDFKKIFHEIDQVSDPEEKMIKAITLLNQAKTQKDRYEISRELIKTWKKFAWFRNSENGLQIFYIYAVSCNYDTIKVFERCRLFKSVPSFYKLFYVECLKKEKTAYLGKIQLDAIESCDQTEISDLIQFFGKFGAKQTVDVSIISTIDDNSVSTDSVSANSVSTAIIIDRKPNFLRRIGLRSRRLITSCISTISMN
uniref:Uncharacterized protein n=1 Tax=Panagrolaimus sp. JU765 TaxID=591449 RepID=A0AC34QCI5_9BILA